MPSHYDIVFLGHVCVDEIVHYGGPRTRAIGSAVLCGAMAAARVGRRVAVVTRMAVCDEPELAPLRQAGVNVHVIPAPVTTVMEVIHPSPDVDDRRMTQKANAGRFQAAELPRLDASWLHLAGVTDQEFSLDLVRALRAAGTPLSADLQSFVRQVTPGSGEIHFRGVPAKRELVALLDRVKLDVVEAEILTGHRDIETAARAVESWGCPEVVVTQAEGVLARAGGVTHYQRFTNRNSSGRTGRGDTTFAAYLSWRQGHEPAESLRFAAALVSLKMEKPGPFTGTLAEVLQRLAGDPS
ncbi:MAG: pfkB family carbohydrate kinase [Lentisphaerae bacterium ADurb.BinA184]|nr:MAG: pfkB family carbohydrate kinase [Lentisphaerae bacterium ADurb.BinA184]